MSYPQILSITPGITGLAAVVPNMLLIDTADTIATVTTVGYLNYANAEHLGAFNNKVAALVTTLLAGVASVNWYKIVVTGAPGSYVYSLVAI